jgi:hypothetical protein
MADTKISALSAVTTPAGTDELAINQAGTSKKITLAQIETFTGRKVITGATGAVSAEAAPSETLQVLTADNADIPTTTLVDQLTAQTLGAGWWLAEYFISWESNVTTTGIAWNLNFTGTQTSFMATRLDATSSATALATVGVADQDSPTASGTGWLPSGWSVRANATDLGPNAGVDTINVIQLSRVVAMFLVTVSGDLVLRAKSEVASTITRVNAGTNARYSRLS